MKSSTNLTRSRQVTVPAHAQRLLGLKPGDRLDITVEGESIIYSKPRFSLENVFGSVPARPDGDPGDFEQLINDAQAASLNRETGKIKPV